MSLEGLGDSNGFINDTLEGFGMSHRGSLMSPETFKMIIRRFFMAIKGA